MKRRFLSLIFLAVSVIFCSCKFNSLFNENASISISLPFGNSRAGDSVKYSFVVDCFEGAEVSESPKYTQKSESGKVINFNNVTPGTYTVRVLAYEFEDFDNLLYEGHETKNVVEDSVTKFVIMMKKVESKGDVMNTMILAKNKVWMQIQETELGRKYTAVTEGAKATNYYWYLNDKYLEEFTSKKELIESPELMEKYEIGFPAVYTVVAEFEDGTFDSFTFNNYMNLYGKNKFDNNIDLFNAFLKRQKVITEYSDDIINTTGYANTGKPGLDYKLLVNVWNNYDITGATIQLFTDPEYKNKTDQILNMKVNKETSYKEQDLYNIYYSAENIQPGFYYAIVKIAYSEKYDPSQTFNSCYSDMIYIGEKLHTYKNVRDSLCDVLAETGNANFGNTEIQKEIKISTTTIEFATLEDFWDISVMLGDKNIYPIPNIENNTIQLGGSIYLTEKELAKLQTDYQLYIYITGNNIEDKTFGPISFELEEDTIVFDSDNIDFTSEPFTPKQTFTNINVGFDFYFNIPRISTLSNDYTVNIDYDFIDNSFTSILSGDTWSINGNFTISSEEKGNFTSKYPITLYVKVTNKYNETEETTMICNELRLVQNDYGYSIEVDSNYFETSYISTPSDEINVGDVILKDGSFIRSGDIESNIDSVKSNAVAVIFRSNSGKVALGVGLNQTECAWCTTDAAGWDNYIDTIDSTIDTDGSDNLQQIAEFLGESDDTNDISRYPAFNYAASYGANNSLTGDYSTGWYLPTLSELKELYESFTSVNNILQTINPELSIDTTKAFLSSSQVYNASSNKYVSYFFFNNFDNICLKNEENKVLVIRKFE